MKTLLQFSIGAALLLLLTFQASGSAQDISKSSAQAQETVAQLKSNPANIAAQKQAFDQGNNFYHDNHFEEARQCYEALLDSGVRDGVLYFNLGNTYAALGENGLAVWAYEKGARILPRDEALRNNLRRLQPKADVSAPFFLWVPFVKFYESFTLNEWLLITDIFFVVGCLLLTAYLLRRHDSATSWMKRLAWLCAVAFVVSGCFLAAKIYHTEFVRRAVVVGDKVLARSGPGENFLESLQLSAGMGVEQLEQPRDHWVKIKLDTGHSGYVPAETIRMI